MGTALTLANIDMRDAAAANKVSSLYILGQISRVLGKLGPPVSFAQKVVSNASCYSRGLQDDPAEQVLLDWGESLPFLSGFSPCFRGMSCEKPL